MNCGRSSSVEWKLPKLQRRVRFPSPAPAPPGHAPGGFVMPTSHPPSTECGGTIGATLSPRELGPAVPVQNSPHTSHTVPLPVQNSPRASWGPRFRYKTHPARPKSPNLVRFALAGRFYPVFVANKPSMANFVPLPPATRPARHHSRYKTRPTRATRCQSRYKTRPTRATRHQFRYKTRPASPKSPNLARFALAGRVLSRFCRQQAEHGEFCPAQTPAPPQARKKQHPHTTHKATR